MVLWEIALGTAYFLGLKRTYRLGLKIQRRIISPKYPRIRHFVHGRTRAVFDVALKVQRNIQLRDIQVGRNLGNWILRWLDKVKPSAQIQASSHQKPNHLAGNAYMKIPKQVTSSPPLKMPQNTEADRHLFSSSTNMLPKSFPIIAMMMRRARAAGNLTQYRHLSFSGPDTLGLNNTRGGGVIRKDKMQWMLHK